MFATAFVSIFVALLWACSREDEWGKGEEFANSLLGGFGVLLVIAGIATLAWRYLP